VPLIICHGDIWSAFDADPNTRLLHGVTHGQPAQAGFAGQVVARFGRKAAIAHYGIPAGDVLFGLRGVQSSRDALRVWVGVTQREYGHADPALIEHCVCLAVDAIRCSPGKLLVPLIGGGLGGLSYEDAYAAIERGVGNSPIPVERWLLESRP
jgi:hypothetical protein